MKCKNCDAELEEGVSLCPGCGFDNTPEQEIPGTEETAEPMEAAAEVQEPEQTVAPEAAEETEAAEAPKQEQQQTEMKPGLSAGKIALLVVLSIAAVAVVVALIVGGMKSKPTDETDPTVATTLPVETTEPTIPADGNPDDVTCKGSYSVSDDEVIAARDQVVATLGDATLTNEELQVYYWMQFYDVLQMYGNYISAMGLDPMQDLDTQLSMDGTLTWQQFLLDGALENWRNYQAMALKAEEENVPMQEDFAKFLEEMPEKLLASAQQAGIDSVEEMIQGDMGKGATEQGYQKHMDTYYRGYTYYQHCMNALELTEEQISAYFDEHAEEYAQKGLTKETKLVDVRHILIEPEGGTTDETGRKTFTEEELAASRIPAQEILDRYLAGEQTAEAFGKLAGEYSADPGSAANGGLYQNVYQGQMVPGFDAWCFDEARQIGDTGLVESPFGTHIMYFEGSRHPWSDAAKQDLMVTEGDQLLKSVVAEYPFSVDYSAIKLGVVDMHIDAQ